MFFTAEGFVGAAISTITGSEFCHVALAFEDCEGVCMFVECQGGTPKRVVDWSFYKDRTVCVLPGPHWHRLRDQAMAGLGSEGYDYLEAGIAGLEDLVARETGWKLETHASGHICSTFVAQVLGVSDQVISPGDLWRMLVVAPDDLWRLLEAQQGITEKLAAQAVDHLTGGNKDD
ncbi:MAG: hypothetical protein PHW13_11945 [Methylococcales bacterium]|nr:hypothetical protein [Methylococcales bacterium]